jgi:hypothetical protein
MMKHIALLSFICVLISCHTQQADKIIPTNLLKGDWTGPERCQENSHNYTTFICFGDSTCLTSLSMWKGDISYEIRKDTLCINGQANTKASQLIRYIIVKLTTDSLVLRSAMGYHDTLQLLKVRPKNNITPTAIYFASSDCFAPCPIMYLAIDSSRNIRFYGVDHTSINNTSIKGGFSGRLSQPEYNSIISMIRNCPVDSLHEYYNAPWPDDQTLVISIVHGKTITRSNAYGHYREPMELHLLFGKLMNLYKNVNLQPDPLVNEDYFLSKPEAMPNYFPYAPSPVPGIGSQEFTPPSPYK